MANNHDMNVKKRLWAAADPFRANANLKPKENSRRVLGLLFLRYAETMYAEAETRIGEIGSGERRKISKDDYLAEGVIFLPEEARFSRLQALTEGDDVGGALNDAMKAIEGENPVLRDVLPKRYTRIASWFLVDLMRLLGPVDIDGDAFERVYEYFMSNFAMKEVHKGASPPVRVIERYSKPDPKN